MAPFVYPDWMKDILSRSGRQVFNDFITNLDGLGALTSMNGILWIYSNDVLPDCEVCDLLDQLTTTPAPIDVHDNLDDSCTPVPVGCP